MIDLIAIYILCGIITFWFTYILQDIAVRRLSGPQKTMLVCAVVWPAFWVWLIIYLIIYNIKERRDRDD